MPAFEGMRGRTQRGTLEVAVRSKKDLSCLEHMGEKAAFEQAYSGQPGVVTASVSRKHCREGARQWTEVRGAGERWRAGEPRVAVDLRGSGENKWLWGLAQVSQVITKGKGWTFGSDHCSCLGTSQPFVRGDRELL